MPGETNLRILLSSMNPELSNEEFIFCTFNKEPALELIKSSWGIIREKEGITLILEKTLADKEHIKYESIYKRITLNVCSSLEAVGLTAKVSEKLTDLNISCNVLAGYYHDHIFVSKGNGEKAIKGLIEMSRGIPA